jgi:hypothetical protein
LLYLTCILLACTGRERHYSDGEIKMIYQASLLTLFMQWHLHSKPIAFSCWSSREMNVEPWNIQAMIPSNGLLWPCITNCLVLMKRESVTLSLGMRSLTVTMSFAGCNQEQRADDIIWHHDCRLCETGGTQDSAYPLPESLIMPQPGNVAACFFVFFQQPRRCVGQYLSSSVFAYVSMAVAACDV